MKKEQFCDCLEALRKYILWERNLYRLGIDLTGTPVEDIYDQLHKTMCGFNSDWAYDSKLELDWIWEWAYDESPLLEQKRHGRTWDLTEAGILYDFIVFMNEQGWEE